MFIILIPDNSYATNGVNLENAGTIIEETALQKVDINFEEVELSDSIKNNSNLISFFKKNSDGTYSAKSAYAEREWVYLPPGTYEVLARNAFYIDDNPLNLKITISFDHDNVGNGQKAQFKGVKDGAGNTKIYLYEWDLDINITYEITDSSGQYINRDFCYGVRDPDGADYLWSGATSSEIYYIPGTRRSGFFEFGQAFKLDSEGIKIQANDLEFTDDGTIFIANNTGSSHFSFTWSTTRDPSFNDMLILPELYYEPHKVNIKINMNGGHLASAHGSMVGTNGDLVTMYGSDIIHKIPFGVSLPDVGLSNWNNPSYINIEKTGYCAKPNEEYYTGEGANRRTYNQVTGYAATDFATDESVDATVTLYVNWVLANYNIGYTLNGGTLGPNAPTSATYNSVIRVSNPTKKGYIFTGWTLQNGNTSTALYGSTNTNVTTSWSNANTKVKAEYFKNLSTQNGQTVTLVANWQAKVYTVVYKGNGGTWNNTDTWSETVTYGSTYNVQDRFYTREGYNFSCWKDPTGATWAENWSGTWQYDNGQYGIENETLVLTAQWNPISYTITYKPNGAVAADVVDTVPYGSKYTVRGYDLFSNGANYIVEWNENSAGGGVSWTIENTNNWTWNYTRNVIVYAIWSDVYTVEYRGNGGTWNNTTTWSETITYGNTYTVQNRLYTYPGHEFVCWKDPTGVTWKEGWSGTWYYTNGQYGITHGKLVLIATWTGNTVTVTVRLDDAAWSNNQMKVALYRNGAEKYAYEDAMKNDNILTWNGVESGTYDVYAYNNNLLGATLVDSGVDLVVTNEGSAAIDYYTLNLNKGVGISAVYTSGIYLKGKPVNIDADVIYGYTWQGWSVISGNSPN